MRLKFQPEALCPAVVALCLAAALALSFAGPIDAEARLEAPLRSELLASDKVERALVEALEIAPRARAIALVEVRDAAGRKFERFASAAPRAALRATAERVMTGVAEAGVDLVFRYGGVAALAVEAGPEGLLALAARPEITHLGLDEPMVWSLAESMPLSGIKAVRGMAKHGKGVWVALLDSGIDRSHRDLKKPLKSEECFCDPGCCPDGSTRQSGKGSAFDDVGHGTAVAGSLVSRGKEAPRGPAMKSKLLMMKVGDIEGPSASSALAALDYVLTDMPEVQVLSMSFGTIKGWKGNCDKKGATNRAYSEVVNALRERGVVVLAASGNGSTPGKMGSPACVKNVLSVGAVYDEDFGRADLGDCVDEKAAANDLVCFTDRSAKIDLVAPGFLITTSAAGGGTLTSAGTSFSSPIAAGCVVLLRQKYPEATVDEIEAALESSPVHAIDPVNGRTYPTLDCQAAFDQLGG